MKMNKPGTGLYFTVKYFRFVFLSVSLFFMVQSCKKSPEVHLKSLINKAIKSNNDVNEQECNEITSYILSKKNKLKEYITITGQPDFNAIQQLIRQLATRRHNDKQEVVAQCVPRNNNEADRTHFNLYIENSMSMDGYVNGNTDFEAAITKLMVLIKNYAGQEKLHINFINSKIFPASTVDISNFAQKLEPKSVTYNVGGKARTISDLNQVFRTVLDSTGNSISVLISDCIYSLGKTGDTEGSLNIQKSLTMDAFLSKLNKSPLATICIKLNSGFNGTYYDKNNTTTIINNKRPYYIWLIGPIGLVEHFYTTLKPETDLDGYQNSFVLFPATEGREPYYTVLKETGKKGNFKTDRSNRDFVHAIRDIGYSDGILQFSIALDLSKIPVDKSYLFDKKNFQVTDGFKIVDIKNIERNDIQPRDWVSIEKSGATHILSIQITRENSIQDLNLELLRQVPGWVKDTHCGDDTDIRNLYEKTFGLKHLVEGVNEAYKKHEPNKQSFFKVTININR